MSISTKNVTTSAGGDYTPMFIEPGNVTARILSIELDQPHFLEKDKGYYIKLNLETKEEEGFEGYFIDPNNQDAGRHKGMIGRVKASRWPYKDGETKKGDVIKRDDVMLMFMKNLCDALGPKASKWWISIDGQYDTIEEIYKAFNESEVYQDVYLNWCIGAREYNKDNGYTGYDLHLPKYERGKVQFEPVDVEVSKLMIFDENKHIERVKAADAPIVSNDPIEPAEDSVAGDFLL